MTKRAQMSKPQIKLTPFLSDCEGRLCFWGLFVCMHVCKRVPLAVTQTSERV